MLRQGGTAPRPGSRWCAGQHASPRQPEARPSLEHGGRTGFPVSQQPQDDKGLARQALGSAVASHGISVLGDQGALSEALTRLLPNSPRERSLLTAAAGADVAGRLRRHIQEGYEDVSRAVQEVARELAERTAIEM